jgi:RimJ/RimL family protein N-acetyltransferase
MTCTIRPATPQDDAALAEQFHGLNLYEEPLAGDRRLDEAGGRESLAACRARVEETGGHALVAELDGRVVGHVFMWFETAGAYVREALRRHAHVADLFVREAARGHGIGTALLAAAERLARAAGVRRITIGVLAGNDGAEALYRRVGYRAYAIELSKALDDDEIVTERLVLRLIGRAAVAAALAGDVAEAGRLLGAAVPEELLAHRRGLEFDIARLDEDPLYAPWGTRAMLRDGVVVGSIRFHTRPDPPELRPIAPGAVEFGYRVLSAHRRQGYAAEAARGAMAWAAREHGVRNFVVTISPGNAASLGLAARLGFRQVGEQMDEEDGLELVLLRPA